jgi:hypothetical protein
MPFVQRFLRYIGKNTYIHSDNLIAQYKSQTVDDRFTVWDFSYLGVDLKQKSR